MSVATVGFRIPSDIVLQETNPATKVTTGDLFVGKKVILFGVPGAFTPDCSRTHLPGYIADNEKFRSKGIDDLICITVNDAYVCGEWARVTQAEGKVRIISDANALLTRALGLEFDLRDEFGLGGIRTTRFSAIVEDSVITVLNVEPNDGLTCSLAQPMLDAL